MPDYPNDSDGDALRRVAADGNDMSAPMPIDFPVVVPDEAQAKAFAAVAAAHAYRVELCPPEEGLEWDVVCSRDLVPDYAEIVRIQHELTAMALPFGGYGDGWGTFGNSDGE